MSSGQHLNRPCPCHSGQKYKRCCAPFHGGAPAPDPTTLMRSRYAAYALGLVEYVLATTDPRGPQAERDRAAWAASVADFSRRTRFEGLEVQDAHTSGDEGQVRFRARLTQGGRDASFTERSLFVRRDGRWLYVSGS